MMIVGDLMDELHMIFFHPHLPCPTLWIRAAAALGFIMGTRLLLLPSWLEPLVLVAAAVPGGWTRPHKQEYCHDHM